MIGYLVVIFGVGTICTVQIYNLCRVKEIFQYVTTRFYKIANFIGFISSLCADIVYSLKMSIFYNDVEIVKVAGGSQDTFKS